MSLFNQQYSNHITIPKPYNASMKTSFKTCTDSSADEAEDSNSLMSDVELSQESDDGGDSNLESDDSNSDEESDNDDSGSESNDGSRNCTPFVDDGEAEYEADSDNDFQPWQKVPYRWISGHQPKGMEFADMQNLKLMARHEVKTVLLNHLGVYFIDASQRQSARTYLTNPKERRIEFFWDHNKRIWAWDCEDNQFNHLPLLITQLSATEQQLASTMLHPGLCFGDESPYPSCNFDKDVFAFNYGRCGSCNVDMAEMAAAMREAAAAVKDFVQHNTDQVKIKKLCVTYCVNQDSSPASLIDVFLPIDGVESFNLNTHHHWDYKHKNGRFRAERDDALLQGEFDTAAFQPNAYPGVTITLDGDCA